MLLLWLNPSACDLPQHIVSVNSSSRPQRPHPARPLPAFPLVPRQGPSPITGGEPPAPALAAPWCHAWAALLLLSSSVGQGCPVVPGICAAAVPGKAKATSLSPSATPPDSVKGARCPWATQAASIWAECCLCWGPISLWLPWQTSVCISEAGCGLAGCVRGQGLLEASAPWPRAPRPSRGGASGSRSRPLRHYSLGRLFQRTFWQSVNYLTV